MADWKLLARKKQILANACWLWLADLASIDGYGIQFDCLKGRWRVQPKKNFTWQNLPTPPSKAHWSAFSWCLRHNFCTSVSPWQMSRRYKLSDHVTSSMCVIGHVTMSISAMKFVVIGASNKDLQDYMKLSTNPEEPPPISDPTAVQLMLDGCIYIWKPFIPFVELDINDERTVIINDYVE